MHKALEADCQSQLSTCRVSAGTSADGAADAGAGAGAGGGSSSGAAGSFAWLLCALLLGYLGGGLLPPPRQLARRIYRLGGGRGGRTVDVDGWALPSHARSSAESMKLS